MIAIIYTDESTIKIDSVTLPGLFKSLEIVGDAIVDEQEVEGQTKKPKQATGYEDAKINVDLVLIESEKQTIREKLEVIQNVFRSPGQEKPEVHEIINEHTAARGISEVIFKKLTTKVENKKDLMTVTMEFWEYTVMEVTATQYTGGNVASSGTDDSTSSSSNLTTGYQEYLENARGSSPALDTASGSQHLETVAGMPYD